MKRILLLLSVFFLICSLVSSCFTPWRGDGGALTVSIGGGNSSNSRAILDGKTYSYEEYDPETAVFIIKNGPNYSVDSDELTRHIITVIDSSGVEQSLTIEGGSGKVYFPSLALGLCTIVVEGWGEDEDGKDELQTFGTTTLDIKYGSNSAAIEMTLSSLILDKIAFAKAERAAVKLAEDIENIIGKYGLVISVDGSVVSVAGDNSQNQVMDEILYLNIPHGVTVIWRASYYSRRPVNLSGTGTLEISGGINVNAYSNGPCIIIESDSPTLKISSGGNINADGKPAIRVDGGANPVIVISGGSIASTQFEYTIGLFGGGTITVSGSLIITRNGNDPDCSYIYRGPSATVKGYYGNGKNTVYKGFPAEYDIPLKDLFNDGSWTDDENLFPIP